MAQLSCRTFAKLSSKFVVFSKTAAIPLRTNWNIMQKVPSVLSSQPGSGKSYSTDKKETISLTFVLRNGEKSVTKAKPGDHLLDVVIDNNVDIDGYGACEGTLACSTCHLIFKPEDFKNIPNEASDEEMDMLDLAYGLTDTSRLGCQVVVEKHMDGWVMEVPKGVADARDV